MTAAHQIYDRLGFRRTPDRDRTTAAGAHIITSSLRSIRECAGDERGRGCR
jgi:hypothetical protein